MLRASIIALALAGLASPAFATEWVNCTEPSGAASFDFLAGGVDVLSIVGMTISVGDRVWASDVAYGPGDPVELGQSFAGNGMILVDAVHQGVLVAELRLWQTPGADLPIYGGTLAIPGFGAWSVSCSGP